MSTLSLPKSFPKPSPRDPRDLDSSQDSAQPTQADPASSSNCYKEEETKSLQRLRMAVKHQQLFLPVLLPCREWLGAQGFLPASLTHYVLSPVE